ncbi:MAG: UDP-3-O-acyl-N-acetylglucosamine deacetylase [Pseudomonadota bacterium]
MIRQRTLQTSICATGLGLHTGRKVRLNLCPAPADSGIVFRRTDLDPVVEHRADPRSVTETELATSLGTGPSAVSTIEHLMAALAGLGVDNCVVELDHGEVPIMDGSAAPFVFLLQSAGVTEQVAPKRFIRVKKAVEVREGDKWARLEPHVGFGMDFTIDFDHPVIRSSGQRARVDFAKVSFINELSRARTFGFVRDFEALRAKGLARGGSLDNAIAVDDGGVLNREGLRYPDEFVKHKVLDAVGDLYLVGHNLIGAVTAYKSGHRLNNLLVRALLEQPSCYEEICFETTRKSPFVYGEAAAFVPA